MVGCFFGQGGREGGKSGPMRRTRLRLRDWVRFWLLASWLRGDDLYGWGIEGVWTYPRSVSVNLWFSPSISKILIVLSEEQVARRRP